MQRKPGLFKAKNIVFGTREKKRLLQLLICVGIFAVMLIGRAEEHPAILNKEDLLQVIGRDTDFSAAFSAFGQSISEGNSMPKGLEELAVTLFGMSVGTDQTVSSKSSVTVAEGPGTNLAVSKLSSPVTSETMLCDLGVAINVPSLPETEREAYESAGDSEDAMLENPPVDELQTEPDIPFYDGPVLPENATMDYFDLGLAGIATPVLGEISSGYGYRTHPLTGESSFHAGVDIAADKGTPIAAFADGKVDFIGESEAYGLYIQLDHGNGIKSFYCHCSELLLGKGKTVDAGQIIALVGDTGDTTGSHLHLELKRENIFLNPLYYIETKC